MKFVVDLNNTETLALQQYAVRHIASADQRSLAAALRRIIRKSLVKGGYLDRDASEDEIVIAGMAWLEEATIVNPPPANGKKPESLTPRTGKPTISVAPEKKPPKPKSLGLKPPSQMYKGKPSNTYKIWEVCTEMCRDGQEFRWYTFDVESVAAKTSHISRKGIDSALRSLTSSGWMMRDEKTKLWSFTEEAKIWITKNAREKA